MIKSICDVYSGGCAPEPSVRPTPERIVDPGPLPATGTVFGDLVMLVIIGLFLLLVGFLIVKSVRRK